MACSHNPSGIFCKSGLNLTNVSRVRWCNVDGHNVMRKYVECHLGRVLKNVDTNGHY
jgi:hypothetical protein